jgi:transcriptional antiterminator Rof (Rho-off)
MENNSQAISADELDSLKIKLESLHHKLLSLENDKKSLKEEAETLQIKAELLRVKARGVEILTTEILKEGAEFLRQVKSLAENNDLGDLRFKLIKALEPLKNHFLPPKNS